MTQILAGAVGGLVALFGVFLAQYLTARSRRRDRLAEMGAIFLTHGAMAADHLSILRDRPEGEHVPLSEVPHMAETMTAGVELSILGGPAVAVQAQAVSGVLHQLQLMALPSTPPDIWFEAMMEFGSQRLQLMHDLRREIGRPVLSDDNLGHDAPDIDDPRSTHTPKP